MAGYVVDIIVLYCAMALGLGARWGRVLSFLCAVLVTWILNRRFTFYREGHNCNTNSMIRELLRYVCAMLVGGFFNLLIYDWIMQTWPMYSAIAAIAVAAGSFAGMLVNFGTSKWLVFIK